MTDKEFNIIGQIIVGLSVFFGWVFLMWNVGKTGFKNNIKYRTFLKEIKEKDVENFDERYWEWKFVQQLAEEYVEEYYKLDKMSEAERLTYVKNQKERSQYDYLGGQLMDVGKVMAFSSFRDYNNIEEAIKFYNTVKVKNNLKFSGKYFK